MEVAVIEPEGGIVPNDDLSVYDLLITSIDNEAKGREDRKREQDEIHEEAKPARERIRRIDPGNEKIVPSQSAVREARMVFWLCLTNLAGSPSLDNLDKARWALRKWRRERLAVSQPIEQAEVQVSEEADAMGEPQVFRTYIQNNAKRSRPDLGGFPHGFPLQQLQPKKTPRRYEKRAKAQAQRRAIEVALVRSNGTIEALEDAYDGLYGSFHRSFDVQLTDEEYLKAREDFAKPARKTDPRYFCHSEADMNLTFASRRVAAVKTKDDGNKKKNKNKKKGGKRKQ